MSPDEYFSGRTAIQHLNVAGALSPAPSVQRFHSLSQYLAMVTAAGFAITALDEPHPGPQLATDPWWREHFHRPMFLLVDARHHGADIFP